MNPRISSRRPSPPTSHSNLHAVLEEFLPILPSLLLSLPAHWRWPAGSSAVEALATGDVETYLIEHSPAGSKPYGGAIPLCMLDEFSIPTHLVNRHITSMCILSPSNLAVDFGFSFHPGEDIPMLRHEVFDAILRSYAQSHGAHLLPDLFISLEPPSPSPPTSPD
ncbi:putative Geranylgeranyl diphosphate reductase, chloroplastic [Cocos nucifera]|uniref:Putative Geranylgeranyl diphosphate reductase, chloroplastic n=1 Tax=Cocos nucifera TaxID=13894 RepID=A0A8K0N5K5_COCNU|nr:putative Geranylgeranyl diphosphate reductase, chloroplastic [Cocos nucifera]